MANDDPGARQDERHMRQWFDRVRAKHRVKRPFRMPTMNCVCQGWSARAPEDIGIIRQRDFLLDAFNDHLKAMRQQRREFLEKQRADRARAKT